MNQFTPPLVSILMPVYNLKRWLEPCLHSIQQQTFQNFEVCCVDDGSTDGSLEVLQRFAAQDSRFKVIAERHQGLLMALNCGLAECKGEFVARMDGDDLMLPERLEKQLAFAKNHPWADLTAALISGFDDAPQEVISNTRYQVWSNSVLTDHDIRREMFVESTLMHPTFFARREFFEGLGGYQDNPWAEDYDLILRAFLAGAKFIKLPEVLVKKRNAPQRTSKVNPIYKRAALFKAKIHYWLQAGWHSSKRGILIAGAGNSGRNVLRELRRHQVEPLAMIDNLVGPPGRKIMGVPAFGFPEGAPPEFIKEYRDCYLMLAIGDSKATQHWVAALEQAGLRWPEDYHRFM